MNKAEILSTVDHTILAQGATWSEVQSLLDEAIANKTASVCISPCYVAQASEYAKNRIPICTVIGFPNGTPTTASKVFETRDAIQNGADEIDMVINVGKLHDKEYDFLLNEIKEIHKACDGKLLKVIIETCLLTDEETIKMCEIVSQSGAEYIKTSTGFSTAGATPHDVELMAKHVESHVKIKAAGGIASVADAEQFLALGASRLGTSRLIKLLAD
ncbi:MAG: deoxyribose-phosphate aldolase [Eubacteriales bacterium]